MNEIARLVVPALRWDDAHGFRYLEGLIDDALEFGVGGFLVQGGSRDDVAALVSRLHAESRSPILVAAHAERGAGQAVSGLIELPCFGALASVAVVPAEHDDVPSLDVDVVRRAARLTARELRSVGVNWALAPVCDLDVARGSSRVGIRGAGGDPAVVAAIVAEWVDACQSESVVACASHFPGIGRVPDGEATPIVRDSASILRTADLAPFVAAIDGGAASVMVSPVRVPALGAPEGAMRSAALIENLLRTELHFDGLVVTVPFDREPGFDVTHEPGNAISAIAAGCDLILAPSDLSGVVDALGKAASRGELAASRVREAIGRVDRWAGWGRPNGTAPARDASLDDVMWSRQVADRCMRYVSGQRPRVGATIEIVRAVNTASRASLDAFGETLRALHIDVNEPVAPTPKERAPLAVQFVPDDTVGDAVTRDELDRARAVAKLGADAGRDTVVVAYCHPRVAAALGRDLTVVCAWEPTRAMQQAAARAIVTAR